MADGHDELDAGLRQELARCCRDKNRRHAEFSPKRPCEFAPELVTSRATGFPMTSVEAWHQMAELLESGHPAKRVELRLPPGKIAYELVIPATPTWCGLYIKLEPGGRGVFCRSFHPDYGKPKS